MEEARRHREREAERDAQRAERSRRARKGRVGNWVGVEVASSRKAESARSTMSSVPSLSTSSSASSALSSPLSPSFPPHSFLQHARPASPQATLRPASFSSSDEEDFFSHLTVAQLTPRQRKHSSFSSRTPPAAHVINVYGDDADEGSLLSYARSMSREVGTDKVGMGYVEFMAREEERDRVAALGAGPPSSSSSAVRGHTRGKLSFDDVLSVMAA